MNNRTKNIIAIALVILGILGRLLPHAWNFAPIAAIGLFAGARLGKKYAFVLPVAAMFLSDMFIGFYDWRINTTVYVAMALSGLIGLCIKKYRNPVAIVTGSIAASTIFFVITNAAVWMFTTMYNSSIQGLLASLSAGLPFFRNALIGDLWYSLAFFGAYELVFNIYRQRMPKKLSSEVIKIK